MPQTAVEPSVCEQCGAAVRESTTFCYSCGKRLAAEPAEEPTTDVAENGAEDIDYTTRAALNDVAAKFKTDPVDDDTLAKAAAERKKASSRGRQTKEVVWEPREDSSILIAAIAAILITIVAGVIVLLTVVWR